MNVNKSMKRNVLNNFINELYELLNSLNKNKNGYLEEMINLNKFYLNQNNFMEEFFHKLIKNLENIRKEKYYQIENTKKSCEEINNSLICQISGFIDEINSINNDVIKNYDNIINYMELEPFNVIINNYTEKIENYKEEINKFLKTPKMINENFLQEKSKSEINSFIESINLNINNFLFENDFNVKTNRLKKVKDKYIQTDFLKSNSFHSNKTRNKEDPLKKEANNLIKSIDKLIEKDEFFTNFKTFENNKKKNNIKDNNIKSKNNFDLQNLNLLKKIKNSKTNNLYIKEKLLNLIKKEKHCISNSNLKNQVKSQSKRIIHNKQIKSNDKKKIKKEKSVYKELLKKKLYHNLINVKENKN